MGLLGDLISGTIKAVVTLPGEIVSGVVKGVEEGADAVGEQLDDLTDP